MIKLPTREDFERYCKANNERNPRHPEYYSHLPARQQWDAWQAAIAEVQRLNATAQPVNDGWVKCSERMPDSNEVLCLVFCRDGETRTGFTSHGDWAMNGKYYDASFVTHWMPLPAAPGGQDS